MRMPLRWRMFLATSTLITILFGAIGWLLASYALQVAVSSVKDQVRASTYAYEALWKAKTDALITSTALLSQLSDVRAAFMTRDRATIRDSVADIWSHVRQQPAIFQILDAEGNEISSLGSQASELKLTGISFDAVRRAFPAQLAGYVAQNGRLYYVVLTPVYVQSGAGPLLLSILCAGFSINRDVTHELKSIAPQSDFVFADRGTVFASTLADAANLSTNDDDVVLRQTLNGPLHAPVAELQVLQSYAAPRAALLKLSRLLAVAWAVTMVAALGVSSYFTRRMLAPVKELDRAASAVAGGDYSVRISPGANDELGRLSATFNSMCDNIQKAQAMLVRQEQIQTIARLTTSLVHDLRNPLAAIYGGAEMLMDGDLATEHQARTANSIYRASQRMQQMLGDLLNAGRSAGRAAEQCRLRDVIDAAIESLGEHERITFDMDGVDIDLVADGSRLERLFTNLLTNSVEAMPDGGRVHFRVEQQADFADVFIEDCGEGMPAEVQQRLFEPFVSGKRTGLGLGLTFSRQTMLDLGGDLTLVRSDAEGTCFRLRFPKSAVVKSAA